MGLGELTDVIGPERVIGFPVGEVRGLAYDSRHVSPGTLFFAVPGVHVDGHEFVPQAMERGALGGGGRARAGRRDRSRSWSSSAAACALADAADAWFGRPSRACR